MSIPLDAIRTYDPVVVRKLVVEELTLMLPLPIVTPLSFIKIALILVPEPVANPILSLVNFAPIKLPVVPVTFKLASVFVLPLS